MKALTTSQRGKWPRPLLHERFLSRFIPEPNSGCWLWEGKLNPYGYGVIQKNGGGWLFAHRVSAQIAGYVLGAGKVVCHRCDNPACVNPDHLFVGSCADNSQDMAAKGRSTRGEKNPQARLTSEDVLAIREDYASSNSDLAKRYGVSRNAIRACREFQTWRHI